LTFYQKITNRFNLQFRAMEKMLRLSMVLMLGAAFTLSTSSCHKKERSGTTGWNYNDPKYGGFEKLPYAGQPTGPNLVLIEGGTFSMGLTEQDVTFEWNNVPRRVTVSSFYMDETEVANIDYREYLHWLDRTFGQSYPEIYQKALPDSLVWREELSYNEPFVENYFRFPSYNDYPVVGVNWQQANEYCKWRTDRVNEMILIEKGIIKPNMQQKDAQNFNTEAYLAGHYDAVIPRKLLKDYAAAGNGKGKRQVKFEDGILLPSYRLPTEAEWEYAALGLKGNMASSKDERITDRRIYPWNSNTVRYQRHDKNQGDLLANFKRSGGDYMGMAGNLNDHAARPAPVKSFWPNDYGLYNMAGNVNEWVQDVYRPTTSMSLRDADNHDLDPFRGNFFQKKVLDENGKPLKDEKTGRLQMQDVKDEEVANRENYKHNKLYNYGDGDSTSLVDNKEAMYDTGKRTLISDKARVFKGGSWADRAFWLSPGSRRFKDEDKGDRSIGFRCAMIRTGSPVNNSDSGGNMFKSRKKKEKRIFGR
jgi:formylglycine-generating enzyme